MKMLQLHTVRCLPLQMWDLIQMIQLKRQNTKERRREVLRQPYTTEILSMYKA
jgi:hypothetical protein